MIIAAAGMAAHLAGSIAAQHRAARHRHPHEGRRRGRPGRPAGHRADAQRHPCGHRGASNGAKNAAVLAAQMLAIHDARIAALLAEDREKMARSIAEKDAAIRAEAAAL